MFIHNFCVGITLFRTLYYNLTKTLAAYTNKSLAGIYLTIYTFIYMYVNLLYTTNPTYIHISAICSQVIILATAHTTLTVSNGHCTQNQYSR